jgi:hypothetical protein
MYFVLRIPLFFHMTPCHGVIVPHDTLSYGKITEFSNQNTIFYSNMSNKLKNVFVLRIPLFFHMTQCHGVLLLQSFEGTCSPQLRGQEEMEDQNLYLRLREVLKTRLC